MAKPRDAANLVSDTITFADITNDRLGVRKTNPSTTLDVNGDITGDEIFARKQVTLTTIPIVRNVNAIASNYTVTTTYNEMSVGPITINTGVTVTINSGARWVVV